MNRTIRFRAWHKGINKMLYPPLPIDSMFDARDSEGNHVEIEQKASETVNMPARMTWDGRCYVEGFLQPLEFMQFTGLKDKNGKDIYEGDIIKLEYEFKDMGVGVVVYQACDVFLQVKSENPYHFLTSFCNEDFCGSVIGNIFENPELLK